MIANFEKLAKLFEGKRIYLSGPMTGVQDMNKQAFDDAQSLLKAFGVKEQDIFNPCLLPEDLDREEAMRLDLAALTSMENPIDVIVILPGWFMSKGAKLEIEIAKELGIKRVFMANPTRLFNIHMGDDVLNIKIKKRSDHGLYLEGR